MTWQVVPDPNVRRRGGSMRRNDEAAIDDRDETYQFN